MLDWGTRFGGATSSERFHGGKYMPRAITGMLATILLAAGLTLVGTTTAYAEGTYAGCPYGAVCVYPNASWNNGHPSLVFWSYGPHNLSNQVGLKRVFNNQYGGAHAYLCWQYNGGECDYPIEMYSYVDYDLTPINSIMLTRT
jgi:hypothetical protein